MTTQEQKYILSRTPT